jgi:HEAT repeat protein
MPFPAISSVASNALICTMALAFCPGTSELDQLIGQYSAEGSSVPMRMNVVSEIAALGSDEAREFLADHCLEARPAILKRALFDALRLELAPLSEELLEEALLDNDPYLRAHGLEILAEADLSATRNRIRDALMFDEDARVRVAAVKILGREADQETVRFVFEECAEASPRQQRQAIASLAALSDDAYEDVLGGEEPWWLESNDSPGTRLLGTLVLASRARKSDKKQLTLLVKDDDPRVAFAAAIGLDRLDSRSRGKAMRKVLRQTRAGLDRCAILRVVQDGGIVDPALTKILFEELEHRDWKVRAMAAEALGASGAEGIVEPLVELLRNDDRWQVQIACVRALGISRRAGAVEILIQLLDQLSGRLAHEAGKAMTTLTGMDLGQRSGSWQRWWADNRDGFEPADPELRQWNDVSVPVETYAFYGIPIVSDRLAFVLDVSGSMGGGKLDRLKKELEAIIARLPEHSMFNMIFFSSTISPWRKQLQPLNKKNRKAAEETLRDSRAGGGTNLWDGLCEAFDDEEVDSIYLLSDGQPTSGEVTNLSSICSRITEINEHRRVAVHVVLIGMKSRHLRQLAFDSGGTYVEHEL